MNTKTKSLNFAVEEEIYNNIKKTAMKNEVAMSTILRLAIKKYLDNIKDESKVKSKNKIKKTTRR